LLRLLLWGKDPIIKIISAVSIEPLRLGAGFREAGADPIIALKQLIKPLWRGAEATRGSRLRTTDTQRRQLWKLKICLERCGAERDRDPLPIFKAGLGDKSIQAKLSQMTALA